MWLCTWMCYHNSYETACNYNQFDLSTLQEVFTQGQCIIFYRLNYQAVPFILLFQ